MIQILAVTRKNEMPMQFVSDKHELLRSHLASLEIWERPRESIRTRPFNWFVYNTVTFKREIEDDEEHGDQDRYPLPYTPSHPSSHLALVHYPVRTGQKYQPETARTQKSASLSSPNPPAPPPFLSQPLDSSTAHSPIVAIS
jgi:hypothetical protein